MWRPLNLVFTKSLKYSGDLESLRALHIISAAYAYYRASHNDNKAMSDVPSPFLWFKKLVPWARTLNRFSNRSEKANIILDAFRTMGLL